MPLLIYDDDYTVTGALQYVVLYDDDGRPLGLVDFEAMEAAGQEFTDIGVATYSFESLPGGPGTAWTRPARGSKFWPEFLGVRVFEFTAELVGPPGQKHINALAHKASGYRRERATIDAAIAARIAAADEHAPVDLRDLVGGPDRPLILDDEGRTVTPGPPAPRPDLPIVAVAVSR